VEEFEGLDFKGALKMLADRAGVQLENFNPKEESEKERLYRVMEEATLYFEKNLKENREALEYLKLRGIEDRTIKDFRIGFVKDVWRDLYTYLKSHSFTDIDIEKAGLVKKTEKGFYDRFRGRIMFPISDSSGRVIAFSGRIFGQAAENTANAKYLNSPDTPIFKKSSVLYGIDKAKSSIRKNDFSIVVEGQFDLILSHQAGFKNTVATSGTSLTDSERSGDNAMNSLGMISHLSENIVFVFDSDKAGLAASERATPIGLALFKDMNVKAAAMPKGMDPADLISKNGVSAWKEVIRNSKHIIEFLVDRYITDSENKDSLKIKLNIEKKIIPYLMLIQNPIRKSHFISMISDKSRIKEEDIRDILNKAMAVNHPNEERTIIPASATMHRKDYIERKLLGIVLLGRSRNKMIEETSTVEASIDANKILKKMSEILNTTEDKLLEKTKDRENDLIFEAEVFYNDGADIMKDTEEMLHNLEGEYLKEKLENKMMELHNAENAKDNKLSAQILKECQILNSQIEDIKNGRLKK
jgi:DNA primase